MFIQLKSNPTPLNFHHFTQQWSPVVVVQQIPRRGRRKWHGPPQQTHLPPAMEAGLGGKTQGTWPRSAQFQGQWERFHKKIHHLSWMRRFVLLHIIQGGLCQDCMNSRRTMSRFYEETNLNCQKCLKYHKHILQIQDPKDRYS